MPAPVVTCRSIKGIICAMKLTDAMIVKKRRPGFVSSLVLALLFSASIAVCAQEIPPGKQRWVSDEFEITMRTGKDTSKSIIRVLPSGALVELLRDDPSSSYSRVRTPGGTEGWVLDRYLMKTPPAKLRLPAVEARLRKSDEQRRQLEQDIRGLRQERAELQRQTEKLEKSGAGLQKDLEEVRRLSADVIEVNEQNRQSRQRLIDNELALDELRAENSRLAARANREWFVIGALVVIFGILIGLILPRIRWRKKSGWGEL